MANSFWQREKIIKKMNSTVLFSVKEQSLETRKLRKLLAKEEKRRRLRKREIEKEKIEGENTTEMQERERERKVLKLSRIKWGV